MAHGYNYAMIVICEFLVQKLANIISGAQNQSSLVMWPVLIFKA